MSILSLLLTMVPALAVGQVIVPARSDFSTITSVAAAKKLAAKGELVPALLFPAELGGHADWENLAYITPQAFAARALAIKTLTRMVRNGTVDQMTVEPDYRGASVVPTRIRMKAWKEGKEGTFEQVIDIW